MLYPARSILALDISPFGQSLALLPSIRALRASYPNTLLVAAAASGTCELLSACGLVDDIIALGVIGAPGGGRTSPMKLLFGLVRRLRRYNFDLVLDFSPRIETQIVTRLVLGARVLTPSKLPRALGMLLELGGILRSPGHSGGSNYSTVLRQAGVEMNDARFAITPPAEEDARFEHRLAVGGSRGGELIVLLYASSFDNNGWPARAFAEIGTRLANNFNVRVVAADEPSDNAFTRAIADLLPAGAIKLAEPRALELLAALARASIVITDESGIARIAAELGAPVIEIADSHTAGAGSSKAHRIARSSSRSRVSTDEVYEIACEVIQESRSPSLFQRP